MVGVSGPARVGLLGCGNVGSALARLIDEHADVIAARAGVGIEIARVAVRDVKKSRDVRVPPDRFTGDPLDLVRDPDIDVIVEMMGGVDPARELITEALKSGKSVVTANKELIARHGPDLFATAAASGVDLLFEASVAGGIPLMRPLRESLAGDRIRRVMGIVNGTTNFILTRMSDDHMSFEDALADAQRLGYAEPDPSADVQGDDAAAKAAIIATIAFGARVNVDDVYREGITSVSRDDIESAAILGYAVKLLAVAEELEGGISVRVHPAMIPVHHPLASVRDAFNAVFIEGEAVGELMLYGRGAGGGPTASALSGDLIDAVKNRVSGAKGATIGELVERPIRAIDDSESQFYLLMEVADRPGVLGAIANEFGEHSVSIKSMEQRGMGEDARLVFVTHRARESALRATLEALRGVETVHRVGSVLRVLGDED
ncbi:MAG: homoserine dehydrogenase [Actinobacteria bacterium]|nr:homoserine dehydrogenase [Actinomycetota bacterium]